MLLTSPSPVVKLLGGGICNGIQNQEGGLGRKFVRVFARVHLVRVVCVVSSVYLYVRMCA
jgi:hypothetical protein